MNKRIVTDSGYWFALYEPRDQYHKQAIKLNEFIRQHHIVIPWPILYETFNTRFVKKTVQMKYMNDLFKKNNFSLIDDIMYRKAALERIFILTKFKNKTYSLVDAVIREILKDKNLQIDYLATFNTRDFIDICAKRKIEIV